MDKSNAGKLPTRDEIPKEFKWRLEDMYPSVEKWEEDYKWVKDNLANLREQHKGKLGDSADSLLQGLNTYVALMEKVEKVFVLPVCKRIRTILIPRPGSSRSGTGTFSRI